MFHEPPEDIFESKMANYLKNAPGKVAKDMIEAAGKQQTADAGPSTSNAQTGKSNGPGLLAALARSGASTSNKKNP